MKSYLLEGAIPPQADEQLTEAASLESPILSLPSLVYFGFHLSPCATGTLD